jgi:hypothetical protein
VVASLGPIAVESEETVALAGPMVGERIEPEGSESPTTGRVADAGVCSGTVSAGRSAWGGDSRERGRGRAAGTFSPGNGVGSSTDCACIVSAATGGDERETRVIST